MRTLQEQLDDPDPSDCGRCAVCAGPRYAAAPDRELVRAGQAALRSRPVDFDPKRMAPDATTGAMRKIPENVRVEPGRALARRGDAGWDEQVREEIAAGRVGDDVVTAMADLVRGWGVRPAWVTAVPSRRAGDPSSDLGARLAAALELPWHPVVVRREDRPRQADQRGAAQQAANVRGAFGVAGEVPTGACLLVDDVRQSGWTGAMVGGQLRRHGAARVHPVVLSTGG
jgi:ATP-dependent DNA helicase RecQ